MWYGRAAVFRGRETVAKDRKVKLNHVLIRRVLMSVLLRQKQNF